MHRGWGCHLALVTLGLAADIAERASLGLRSIILPRRNIGAPQWPAIDNGRLPGVIDPVAETAQPVFLIHALAKRSRETR